MTQEEKARAYDEAMERAKKYNVDDAYASQGTLIKSIFPELAESEDERIRKYIIRVVNQWWDRLGDPSPDYPTRDEMLAYLEKQKEQKTLSTEETKLNSIAFLEQMGYTCIPPGKEPESIEDVIKYITKNKEAATKFLKCAGIMDDNGELAKMYRSEQKSMYWSEKDEDCYNEICRIINNFADSPEQNRELTDWLIKTVYKQ